MQLLSLYSISYICIVPMKIIPDGPDDPNNYITGSGNQWLGNK